MFGAYSVTWLLTIVSYILTYGQSFIVQPAFIVEYRISIEPLSSVLLSKIFPSMTLSIIEP